MNQLQQLSNFTKIVIDTGDLEQIKKFTPLDATTNPSLILAAIQKDDSYHYLLEDAISFMNSFVKEKNLNDEEKINICVNKLIVNFGLEILKIIPGRVSTEVDVQNSFDTEKTISNAKEIISLYEQNGIDKKKILIKIASTWEGIKAAEKLEQEGISCNLTLLFSLTQAIACAEAGVTLISPFVGRILDWYKQKENKDSYSPFQDPGVKSVTQIYHYYKKKKFNTEIMGASFRNKEEVIALAGCDLLTISPNLLAELESSDLEVVQSLFPKKEYDIIINKEKLNEATFRWQLNENEMANEKLSEGIRKFSIDLEKLQTIIREKI